MHEDGTGTETLYDSNGGVGITGAFEEDGDILLIYDDGSTERVDVDTGEMDPDGLDDWDDADDGSEEPDRSARRHVHGARRR